MLLGGGGCLPDVGLGGRPPSPPVGSSTGLGGPPLADPLAFDDLDAPLGKARLEGISPSGAIPGSQPTPGQCGHSLPKATYTVNSTRKSGCQPIITGKEGTEGVGFFPGQGDTIVISKCYSAKALDLRTGKRQLCYNSVSSPEGSFLILQIAVMMLPCCFFSCLSLFIFSFSRFSSSPLVAFHLLLR